MSQLFSKNLKSYCLETEKLHDISFTLFSPCDENQDIQTRIMSIQQPVLFLSHGGGPSFYLDAKKFPMMKGLDKNSQAAEFLRNLTKTVKLQRPRAILVLSAHWEEYICKVQITEKPQLYYDYAGFPTETYKLSWPVPGSPDLARRAKSVLESNGIKCQEVSNRGLDHGVFVPLKLVFPEADIPGIFGYC